MSKYQLQYQIQKVVQEDNNCSVYFEWTQPLHQSQPGPHIQLQLITYNPLHHQHFLLHTCTTGYLNSSYEEKMDESLADHMCSNLAEAEIFLLHKMLDYVTEHQETANDYTIVWRPKNTSHTTKTINNTTSHFRGTSFEDVLRKFYYDKEKDTLILYSIIMSPES